MISTNKWCICEERIRYYTIETNNSWISLPHPFEDRRSLLLSGDKDILCSEINELKSKYGAIAADWES